MKLTVLLWALCCCSFAAEAQFTGFGDLQWRFFAGGKCYSAPAIFNDLILVGNDAGALRAINLADGKEKWRFQCGAIGTAPVVQEGKVFFGSYDGHYYALDAGTGTLIWRFATGGESRIGARGLWTMQPDSLYMTDLYDFFLSTPAVDDRRIYFGSSDGCIYALDKNSGLSVWKFQTGGKVHGGVTVHEGRAYAGSWDSNIYALDAVNGREIWRFTTARDSVYHVLEGIQATPLVSEGLVVIGSRDAHLYALDAVTGALKWKYDAGNAWVSGSAIAAGDRLFVGTSDSYLMLALDAYTGREIFRQHGGGYIFGAPAAAGNTICYGDFTGRIRLLDKSTGKILDTFDTPGRTQHAATVLNASGKLDFMYSAAGKDPVRYSTNVAVMDLFYKLGPVTSAPVLHGNSMYFTCTDGYLYAVALKKE
ncbi:PQQ-binding-like beta-propeller repeat protein [Chitinophaga sp.]|uniref:PQQ-binding-like beta-propeller repeat protein n=1 Tax=Chitinophaga sp. TaxID=1869181 RepID=UPI0031DD4BA9